MLRGWGSTNRSARAKNSCCTLVGMHRSRIRCARKGIAHVLPAADHSPARRSQALRLCNSGHRLPPGRWLPSQAHLPPISSPPGWGQSSSANHCSGHANSTRSQAGRSQPMRHGLFQATAPHQHPDPHQAPFSRVRLRFPRHESFRRPRVRSDSGVLIASSSSRGLHQETCSCHTFRPHALLGEGVNGRCETSCVNGSAPAKRSRRARCIKGAALSRGQSCCRCTTFRGETLGSTTGQERPGVERSAGKHRRQRLQRGCSSWMSVVEHQAGGTASTAGTF